MVGWAEMPRSPGHVFFDRLQAVLAETDFDGFVEAQCAAYYASRRGRPSLPPGRYFLMHLLGYFEGISSERGLERRCSDSLSLRALASARVMISVMAAASRCGRKPSSRLPRTTRYRSVRPRAGTAASTRGIGRTAAL